jgi:hypothetical protein
MAGRVMGEDFHADGPEGSGDMTTVETARGPVPTAELGPTLMHEHIVTRSPGVQENWPHLWDRDEVLALAERKLGDLYARGIRTIVDLTRLPPGYELDADVAAVGVDAHDNVYAFNRGAHPMVVLDRDGNFLRSWGEGVFRRAHGLHVAPDDTLWLTDDGDHTVRHCTLDGKCC